MTNSLTIADVLAIHGGPIERYGGSPGTRDAGLLEAALFRPQTGYYAGNKRTAFAVMYTFLALNGVTLTEDWEKADAFLAKLYSTDTFRFNKLVPWLRRHVRG